MQVFSVKSKRVSHDFDHHDHEHDHHTTTRFNPTTALCLRVAGGSRQDTHGTPMPEREGRGWPTTCSTTDDRQTDDKPLRQTCFQQTGVKTNVRYKQPRADSHLESYMVAELVRETRDLRRVVELREQTRRQKSRSGDVPDHQEDYPAEDSTTRPSTSRFSQNRHTDETC